MSLDIITIQKKGKRITTFCMCCQEINTNFIQYVLTLEDVYDFTLENLSF